MAPVAEPALAYPHDPIRRLFRAGLLTGISDGLFASVLSAFFYGSTVMALWQGVASVPFSPRVFEGGVATALLGVVMHFGVAFFWSAIFLFVVMPLRAVRSFLASPSGVIAAAVIYGPIIWLTMSFVVIPAFLHHRPAITTHWWIQFVGHIPFVALPMITMLTRGLPRTD